MQGSKESQCYFVQLQIDSFLDGELANGQQQGFLGHVQDCAACAKELHFASSLHDAVMDLPLLDCSQEVLEPVHRIAQAPESDQPSMWQAVTQWLGSMPLTFRLAAPAFALVLIAVSVTLQVQDSEEAGQQVATQLSSEEFSPEDVQQALQDLNLAIDYLNEVSQRTEVMIGERFLVNPLQDSLNASFSRRERARDESQTRPEIQGNPI